MDPQVAFYLAQGISILTGIMAILTMQFKNMTLILLFQMLVNLLASTNYLLLGGSTGAIVSVLAIAQATVMYFHNRKQKKPHLAVTVLFLAAYFGCAIYNIVALRDGMEILPALCAFCFSIGLIQEKSAIFRIWSTLNSVFWLPYDIYTQSYVMFFVHFGILTSSVVGMIRLDGRFRFGKKKQ